MKKPTRDRPNAASRRSGENRARGGGIDIFRDGPAFSVTKSKSVLKKSDYTVPLARPSEEKKNTNLDIVPDKYTPKGKKLRKVFERPRPDLPSDAPENRSRKIVSMTLPPDLLEAVNQQCRELNVDRSSYMEAALRAFMKPSP